MNDMLNEKWQANGGSVVTWDGALCADTVGDEALAQAIAVLPEALALLKERMSVDAKGHPQCPCDFCVKGRDILKRAGVLK